MQINNFLDSINNASQINELTPLINSAKATVSFWGERLITATNYTGSVSLDSLAKKVLNINNKHNNTSNLIPQQKLVRQNITKKIQSFYAETDDQVSRANWFTRLLLWLREFTNLTIYLTGYNTRFEIEEMRMETIDSNKNL